MGVKLIIHLHPVSRLRMTGVILLLPYTPSWRAERQLSKLQKDPGTSILTTSTQARTQTNVFRRRGDIEEAHVFAPSICPPDDRNVRHTL